MNCLLFHKKIETNLDGDTIKAAVLILWCTSGATGCRIKCQDFILKEQRVRLRAFNMKFKLRINIVVNDPKAEYINLILAYSVRDDFNRLCKLIEKISIVFLCRLCSKLESGDKLLLSLFITYAKISKEQWYRCITLEPVGTEFSVPFCSLISMFILYTIV